ncbi:MAG: GNAT family N-acetyltransferase [Nocardioides sp.]
MLPDDYTVVMFDDPRAFLVAGEAYFREHRVEAAMIAVTADRAVRDGRPERSPYFWFALVRDPSGYVVGAAMRTAAFAPYPLYVTSMPDPAARLLGTWAVGLGEDPGGANGTLPAAGVVAETMAAALGRDVEMTMATRLWELGTLVPPTGVQGRGRLATETDLDLCLAWFNDFRRAADEQAGRPSGSHEGEALTPADMRARIDQRRVVLWEADGVVVHLTGLDHPVLGVGHVGPVYTPREHRGYGYAAAGVAYASQLIVEAGGRSTLYTDLDNPVSNGVYARLGYEPAFDTANFELVAR